MTVAGLFTRDGEGNPDVVEYGLKPEVGRHDPDDRVGLAVQEDVGTEDVRIRSEAPLPQAVTDEGDLVPTLDLLLLHEASAQCRLHTQDSEPVPAQPPALRSLGSVTLGQVEGSAARDGHLHRLASLAEVDKIRNRKRDPHPPTLGVRGVHGLKLMRVRVRKRPEHEYVDGRKDGGHGADADSEGQDRDNDQETAAAQ